MRIRTGVVLAGAMAAAGVVTRLLRSRSAMHRDERAPPAALPAEPEQPPEPSEPDGDGDDSIPEGWSIVEFSEDAPTEP